jgi:hypothetical protein
MIAAAIIAHALGGQREGRGWGCRCPLHNGRSLTLPRTSRRKDLAGTARALEFGAFPSAAPGFLEVFIARAEARALLCAACEVTLHDAVDQLQLAAERDGLLAKVGQDEVNASWVPHSPACGTPVP